MKKASGIGFLNIIGILIYIFLWITIFCTNGMLGIASWTAVKLVLPFVGLVFFIINLLIWLFQKNKHILRRIICAIVSLAYIFPILLTVNIVQIAYPTSIQSVTPHLTITSPIQGEVIVAWGGDAIEGNQAHAGWASERWANDLVMEPYDTGNENLESYGIWNQAVYSPVEGTVIAAYDKEADIMPNQDDFLSLEGNYVYIHVYETDTYLLLNHLKQDSVVVSVGDVVQSGDLLGSVGNSGTSSEPHLHIHHQRQNPLETVYPLLAQGLPLFFWEEQDNVMPKAGDILSSH